MIDIYWPSPTTEIWGLSWIASADKEYLQRIESLTTLNQLMSLRIITYMSYSLWEWDRDNISRDAHLLDIQLNRISCILIYPGWLIPVMYFSMIKYIFFFVFESSRSLPSKLSPPLNIAFMWSNFLSSFLLGLISCAGVLSILLFRVGRWMIFRRKWVKKWWLFGLISTS